MTQSHRPDNNEINAGKIIKRQAERELRDIQESQGLLPKHRDSLPNSKCPYKTTEEEQIEREEAATETLRIMRAYLPALLKRLIGIKDPRQPKKCKHKLTIILIYGILCFVFQMSSRREANREMSRPMFVKNLQLYFPELETLPHNDTLKRLLDGIDVNMIENIHMDLLRDFIRKKSFAVI
jgi:hypothetical protein